MPDLASAARVERIALVRSRHVHDSADYHRSRLQSCCVGHGEYPTRRKLPDRFLVDLRQSRVPVAAGFSVVRRPVGPRRYLAKAVLGSAKEMNPLVWREKLQIIEAFPKDFSP